MSCAANNKLARRGRDTSLQNSESGHSTCSLIVGPESIQGLGSDQESLSLRNEIINELLPAAGYVVFDSSNAAYAGADALQLKMSVITSRQTSPYDGLLTPPTFNNTLQFEVRNSQDQIFSKAIQQYNVAKSPAEIPARRRALIESALLPHCNLSR